MSASSTIQKALQGRGVQQRVLETQIQEISTRKMPNITCTLNSSDRAGAAGFGGMWLQSWASWRIKRRR
jgi:hypothetical protein